VGHVDEDEAIDTLLTMIENDENGKAENEKMTVEAAE
jgi:hypothetical protein